MSTSSLFFVQPDAEQTKRFLAKALGIGGAVGLTSAAMTAFATVPQEVTDNVETGKAVAKSLGNLSTAALAAVLVPFAAMLTIKFLSMVMARV